MFPFRVLIWGLCFFLVRVQGFSAFWAWGFGIMVTLRSRCLDPYPKDKGHD